MRLEALRKANPGLAICGVDEPSFAAYGRVMAVEGLEDLAALADRITGIDAEANRYVASLPELEAHPAAFRLGIVFGGAQVELGYCNGPNSRLNGLEYHKSPEIDVAVTDLVLLLGKKRDLGADLSYESRRLEAFYLPAGTAVELWPEVLHYSPCKAGPKGFKSIIALPRGTNEALGQEELAAARDLGRAQGGRAARDPEARLLFMRNKWLLAHPERTILVERGAWPGIRGENIEVHIA
jgi:hypothetical protein